MDFSQSLIDVLRAAHLLCFAAGMGTALFFDFRSFQTLGDPITIDEVDILARIHIWISAAFGCMWITGLTLIYIRTSFDLNSFSPKLWLKVAIMTLLIWNARKVGATIIPMLRSNVGLPLIMLPTLQLMAATQLAINSMFCWTCGLLLGSSVMLKTAHWETLLPLAFGWFVILTCIGQLAVLFVRMRHRIAQKTEFLQNE